MTIHLFLKPLDIWLFRDGRPFNREVDHRAVSLFPPLPTVVQGAIRTHYIEQHGGIPAYLDGELPEVETVVGKKGSPPPDTFKLSGPFVARLQNKKLTHYFPRPAHTYLDGNTIRLLKPRRLDDMLTNLPDSLQLLWMDAQPTKQEENYWLTEQGLGDLLTQQKIAINEETTIKESNIFRQEHRLGIDRLDDSLGSEEGAIYQVEFIRPCPDVGLYVAVEGITDWPERGTLRLGGEGHLATYQQVALPEPLPRQLGDSGRFTLTFLTPTWFAKGWQPQDNWSMFFDGSPKLIAAALNRPLVMGGFDVANQAQKPARRYVPVGSTYYFEGQTAIKTTFICDNKADGRIGFGQFIIGAW